MSVIFSQSDTMCWSNWRYIRMLDDGLKSVQNVRIFRTFIRSYHHCLPETWFHRWSAIAARTLPQTCAYNEVGDLLITWYDQLFWHKFTMLLRSMLFNSLQGVPKRCNNVNIFWGNCKADTSPFAIISYLI